jgi:hypothetical protein
MSSCETGEGEPIPAAGDGSLDGEGSLSGGGSLQPAGKDAVSVEEVSGLVSATSWANVAVAIQHELATTAKPATSFVNEVDRQMKPGIAPAVIVAIQT